MQHDDAYYGTDKLFTLKDARDPGRMRAALAAEMPHFWSPAGAPAGVDVEMLRRRKQRCVLRYRVHMQATDGRDTVSWIGKVYKADHGAPVADLMRQLWDAGFQRDAADGIAIPEVVAYLPRLALLLQEEIGGLPVKDHLTTDTAEPALRAMARALAKLHRVPVRVGPTYRVQDHLRRCHPMPNVLRERCPELRPAVDEILREASRLESSYAGFEPALVHGDFHMGQVHVGGGRTWLIDFDACCVADPAADLGNVLVFLKGKARKIPSAPLLADAFLDEYFRLMPSEIGRRVALHEALTHLRRACKRLRMDEDGWEKKARRFLDESLESLAAARG
jgi:aminoglycoside phosphotransferase (APT) family kinase protein